MDKVCTKCLEPLDELAFSFKNKKLGTRQSVCKECHSKEAKAHYENNKSHYLLLVKNRKAEIRAENRQRLVEYLKTHPCVDCEEPDLVVLHFDHIRGKKTKEVTRMVDQGWCWETICKEISKCDVRCANCHLRRTSAQFGWWNGKFRI